MRAVRGTDPRRLDGRYREVRAVTAWSREIVADLGGDGAISTQKRTLIATAARTKFVLDVIDTWLLGQRALVNARKRSVLPIVLERERLVDSLRKTLELLGLERKARPVPSASEIMRGGGA